MIEPSNAHLSKVLSVSHWTKWPSIYILNICMSTSMWISFLTLKSQTTNPILVFLAPEWHTTRNSPASPWISHHMRSLYIRYKLWTLSPVILSMIIWLLTQLELRRWAESYFFHSHSVCFTSRGITSPLNVGVWKLRWSFDGLSTYLWKICCFRESQTFLMLLVREKISGTSKNWDLIQVLQTVIPFPVSCRR